MKNYQLHKNLKAFFVRNKTLIIFSVIIAVICYGYELFNFTFSIDEELRSMQRASEAKGLFIDGRWGTYFINWFFSPQSVIPFLPTLISIMCIAFSSVLFISNEKGDLQSKLIFSTIFITYPLHSYYLEFNVLSMSLGVGMVLSVLSYLITKKALIQPKNKITLLGFASILLMFSFSIYQGLIPIYVTLTMIYFFNSFIYNKLKLIKDFAINLSLFIAVFCVAFVLYKICTKILEFIYIDRSINNSYDYLKQFNGWGKYSSIQVITNLFRSTYSYLIGNSFYGAKPIVTIFGLIPILIYYIILKVKGNINKIVSIFLIGLIIISPFFVMYVIGTPLPARSLPALPFIMAFIWWIAFQKSNKWIRRALIVLAIVIFFNNSYHTTRLFYSSSVTWHADRDMANRIAERVYQLDVPQDKKPVPVAFVGFYQHPTNQLFFRENDVFGTSFFGWDMGNPYRMNCFFKSMGINNFEVVPRNKVDEMADTIKTIPNWPYKGSVTMINGTVVVKLSEQKHAW